MKIVTKTDSKKVTEFRNLIYGDVFQVCDQKDICIKTASTNDSMNMFNLSANTPGYLYGGSNVIVLEAELHIL